MSSDLNEGGWPYSICPLDGKPCEGQGTAADCDQCAIDRIDNFPVRPFRSTKVARSNTASDVEGYYAFWKYDLFPFVLGGTITRMLDNGMVSTVEFGPGNYFKPIKKLSMHEGKALKAKLQELSLEYKRRDQALRDEMLAKVKALVPEV